MNEYVRLVFEDELTPDRITTEDGGQAKIGEISHGPAGDISEDQGMFVRLQSWYESGRHAEFDELAGRYVRVTVEAFDQEAFERIHRILSALSLVQFNMAYDPEDHAFTYRASLSRVDIKEGGMLCSFTGWGDSPEQAVLELWEKATDLPEGQYLVKNALGSEPRQAIRWNGFMWEPVQEGNR